ncbi:MAG: VanZ family protein [Clostridiaceae bacterium]|nr:VanZ family protein [Eubacteriales bacterium]
MIKSIRNLSLRKKAVKGDRMFLGYLVRVLPGIALVSLIIYLPGCLLQKRRFGKRPFVRHLVVYAFLGCCGSLLYLTILWYYPYITFRPYSYALNLRPFIWVREVYAMGAAKMFEQLLTNIVMFVPYGLLLPMVFDKLKKPMYTALVVLATTLAIETIQYFMGRSADIDDVIMNAVGGIAGYFLYALLRRAFGEKPVWQNAVRQTPYA